MTVNFTQPDKTLFTHLGQRILTVLLPRLPTDRIARARAEAVAKVLDGAGAGHAPIAIAASKDAADSVNLFLAPVTAAK